MTMSSADSGVIFRPGVPPETTDWPGPEPSVSVDGDMRIERNVTAPMRDGKLLRVDVYRPDGAQTPLPVLIAWAPYGKHGALDWSNWPDPASTWTHCRPTPPSRRRTPSTGLGKAMP